MAFETGELSDALIWSPYTECPQADDHRFLLLLFSKHEGATSLRHENLNERDSLTIRPYKVPSLQMSSSYSTQWVNISQSILQNNSHVRAISSRRPFRKHHTICNTLHLHDSSFLIMCGRNRRLPTIFLISTLFTSTSMQQNQIILLPLIKDNFTSKKCPRKHQFRFAICKCKQIAISVAYNYNFTYRSTSSSGICLQIEINKAIYGRGRAIRRYTEEWV